KVVWILSLMGCFLGTLRADIPAGDAVISLTNDTERISYAIGVLWGLGLRREEFEVDLNVLEEALREAYVRSNRLSGIEAQRILAEGAPRRSKRKEEELRRQQQENLSAGSKFLRENRNREGVKETSSGLQYRQIRPGYGKRPASNDVVTVK